jgi:hypothetical protein
LHRYGMTECDVCHNDKHLLFTGIRDGNRTEQWCLYCIRKAGDMG